MDPREPVSRHDFLKHALADAGQGLGGWLGALLGTAPPKPAPARGIRPPGALSEPEFLRACTRCDACAGACPAYAIKVAGPGDPFAPGTPFMHDLVNSPCVLCPDTPCITSCEPGALRAQPGVSWRLGLAEIDEGHCLAHAGQACRACVDACPLGDHAIVVHEGRPIVVPLGCTGCGQCLSACPADVRAISVSQGP